MERDKGNFIVVGKTGSGKTTTLSQTMRVLMVKHDVSQLKEQYSSEDREKFEEAFLQNCNIWYPLKHGGRHGE